MEGTLGIVPELAPKIMLNEEGENITLSDNKAMFTKWANSESYRQSALIISLSYLSYTAYSFSYFASSTHQQDGRMKSPTALPKQFTTMQLRT